MKLTISKILSIVVLNVLLSYRANRRTNFDDQSSAYNFVMMDKQNGSSDGSLNFS